MLVVIYEGGGDAGLRMMLVISDTYPTPTFCAGHTIPRELVTSWRNRALASLKFPMSCHQIYMGHFLQAPSLINLL